MQDKIHRKGKCGLMYIGIPQVILKSQQSLCGGAILFQTDKTFLSKCYCDIMTIKHWLYLFAIKPLSFCFSPSNALNVILVPISHENM